MMALVNENKENFAKFFQGAHKDGALDAKTKELLHIVLVLAMRCEPWAESHLAVARQMGITEEELAEAIQLAVSVGGGTIKAMAQRASAKSESSVKEDTKLSQFL
jgi:AhpD family alkylhydroperoxidase